MDQVESRIIEILNQQRLRIIDFAEDIFAHPELGFKEERTAEKVAVELKKLGLPVRQGLAITGLKAYLNRNCDGNSDDEQLTVAVIGELDAVRSPYHPNSDPISKAAHACGHHAQLAALFGAAIALSDPEVSRSLDGNVIFFAVPAEEYGEIEFKKSLREKGLIEFLGGKAELIRLGEFDEIDIALTHHSSFSDEAKPVVVGSGSTNGFIAKRIRYIGKEAHAAGGPHEGINALNAALIGLNALNAQRETFKDDDAVRIHPILTKGGDLVNVIPGEAIIELLVRARTLEAILDANAKATRSFEAGAYAIGAQVEINDFPGYLPRVPESISSPITAIAKRVVGADRVWEVDPKVHNAFSSDVGDVSHILPVFSFTTGGTTGESHAANFRIVDPEMAYIVPAKIMALTVYDMLKNSAANAKRLKTNYQPRLTREQYVQYLNSVLKS
ncbi:MAG: amidohydrolase [Bacteroidota bacterium]